jgi:hypothetical protein
MQLVSRFSGVAACLTLVVCGTARAALMDITRPGDPIALVNGVNQGPDTDAGPPPAAETVDHAIDDVGQKYLNFLDLNSGFSVTPTYNSIAVTGLRLYTANDAEPRDPASFQLYGTDVGLDAPLADWTVIASGNLALPAGRNAGGNAVSIPPDGNLAAFYQEVSFANDNTYEHYRLVFPTLKDAVAANSMQIAEVELLGIPEPSSIVLAGLAAGLLAWARRRR